MKKIWVGFVAILAVLLGGYGVSELGAGRLNLQERIWMNELSATTTASNIVVSNVADFVDLGVTIATTNASGTVKFACSTQQNAPTFTSAKSATNRWDYVDVADLESGIFYDGDTGFTHTNTSDVRQFELNVNNFRWCTAIQTPWAAGTTTITMLPANSN